jgi:hypothetical protein
MAKKQQQMPKLIDVPFPYGGMATEQSFSRPLQLGEQGQIATTFSAQNIVPFNPVTGRQQGAQRSGLVNFHDNQADSGTGLQIQDINSITVAKTTIPTDGSLAYRSTTILAVADGDIVKLTSSGGYADPAGGTGASALNSSDNSPVVFSAVQLGVVYYVDGAVYKKYTASTDTVATWTASTAGTLPLSGSNTAKLICSWGGRIVLSGVAGDEHNWFISALNDPLDFDYATDFSEDDAIAGNTPNAAGKCLDIINCLLPYSEDILLMGCDHSIYMMDGFPTAGGRMVLLTESTGMSWGRPFASDENGVFYFFGSRGGVFRITDLNSPPQRITQGRIDNQLTSIDLTANIVRMAWDDAEQALRVFITALDGTASTHWYWCRRTDSWWKVVYADPDHNPLCVHTIDADDPDDRKLLLGCVDSRVRYHSATAKDDAGTAISSHVYLGPMKMQGDAVFRLDELQATLDNDSDQVEFEVISGRTYQDAYENATPDYSGRWGFGKNMADRRRASGRAIFVKISNDTTSASWAFESLLARVHPFGPIEQRRIG